MIEWMIMPLKRYADFSGRSRRKEYWWFAVLNVLVFAVFGTLRFAGGGFEEMAAAGQGGNPFAVYGVLFSGVGMVLALWWLATLIPNIAVNVRRLHDRDMSGWWYLGFFVASLIPLVNIIVSIGYLVLMFLEGTRGPNRFGPDPKNPDAAADVFV
ncbi:MAG TPA: DUF805 domain-containing protein [Novosphingobium sp.]|nr:DUF805 domain-containing protein [Novosphingobium sp.]